jgi:predicted membrane-bound mannosyltransferase
MTEHKGACCSSPAAMCYWFATSLIAWGALSLVGIYWHPLHALSPATILFAMAIGCAANWLRNRTFHCGITGPLFLVTALVFLISDMTTTHLSDSLVWAFVLIGVGVAFLLEWRYASVVRPKSDDVTSDSKPSASLLKKENGRP